MSRVNLESAQNNVERVTTNLNELQQFLSSKKDEVATKISEINGILSAYFKQADELNQLIAQEEEKKSNNTTELNQLNQKLQKLTHNKDVLQSEISSKQKDIQQLLNLIMEREQISTELKMQVDSLTEKMSGFKRKIEELDVLSHSTSSETSEAIRSKEIRLADLNSQYTMMISRSKALKYLVKKDIVVLPEVQVIRSLTTPGINTEENLKKMSGVSEQIIRNILVELAKREIITYESHTGKFQVITEIDI
jgi:chromosome segregation ATPase